MGRGRGKTPDRHRIYIGLGIARRIRVFASQIRTGFGRLPASSPDRYKRFAFV